jgi:hypothetical protein
MTTTTSPATAKQVAFVQALVQRVYGADNAPEHFLVLEETGALDSTKSASKVIDGLLALAKAAPKAAAPAPKASPSTVATGFYALDGNIYRVVPARHGSHNYAKVLVPTGSGARWEYAKGAMSRLAGLAPMTAAEAAAYGKSHGYCMVCGKLLTDPESIARGIGPVCAKGF